MSPYRDDRERAPETPAASAPVKDAIERMVKQFADDLAFYRELVQNAIDAGATRVDVHLRWDPTDDPHGMLRIAVTDDGSGMTQEVVEGSLLVLFRSTKEHDPTKIGKFGVGFFSVFAVAPEVVTVETGTGTGMGLALTLRPDFSWELVAAAPRKGTTVTLKVPLDRESIGAYAERSIAALRQWCPHVAVSIRLALVAPDGTLQETRIDSPFDPNDGETLVVLERDGSRYSLKASETEQTRFFNRGILLHETSSAIEPGVQACIDHPRLGHTISRDDVRRDDVYEAAVARARQLARKRLREHVVSAVAQAADEVTKARPDGPSGVAARARFASVARAAGAFGVPAAALTWPLVDPVRDGDAGPVSTARLTRTKRSGALFARARSSLTEMLAARGVPVVDVGDGSLGTHEGLVTFFGQCFPGRASDAEARWGLASPCTSEAEDALVAVLRPLLAAVGIPGVAFAEIVGLGSEQIFIALDALPTAPALLQKDDVLRPPLGLFGGRPIVISRRRRAAIAAAQLASTDPRTAAFLLARLVLLATDALDAKRDDALVRAALERA